MFLKQSKWIYGAKVVTANLISSRYPLKYPLEKEIGGYFFADVANQSKQDFSITPWRKAGVESYCKNLIRKGIQASLTVVIKNGTRLEDVAILYGRHSLICFTEFRAHHINTHHN